MTQDHFDPQRLRELDLAAEPAPVNAKSLGRRASEGSLADPGLFACSDNRAWWGKGKSQSSLGREYIAGRIAHHLESGPEVGALNVTPEALPEDGSASDLLGLILGSSDLPGAENSKKLMDAGASLDPNSIDRASRARATVVRAWLGVSDNQVMVSPGGAIFAIDFGSAFDNLDDAAPISLAPAPLPGVDDAVGRERAHVEAAVAGIEAITDEQLAELVAGVPADWNCGADERSNIARWLARRRDRLREVARSWWQ